jgi:hypothetical protein
MAVTEARVDACGATPDHRATCQSLRGMNSTIADWLENWRTSPAARRGGTTVATPDIGRNPARESVRSAAVPAQSVSCHTPVRPERRDVHVERQHIRITRPCVDQKTLMHTSSKSQATTNPPRCAHWNACSPRLAPEVDRRRELQPLERPPPTPAPSVATQPEPCRTGAAGTSIRLPEGRSAARRRAHAAPRSRPGCTPPQEGSTPEITAEPEAEHKLLQPILRAPAETIKLPWFLGFHERVQGIIEGGSERTGTSESGRQARATAQIVGQIDCVTRGCRASGRARLLPLIRRPQEQPIHIARQIAQAMMRE